ncbi:MAG TPA: DnaJ domain-containing protein [Casimicrobiaceae bacterium]|nr:DnaJ domain-containing protein [Casimicrobiaceae bacterium]
MKATLYEALGISQTASDEEVRASLRRLIRKYYAKTRDGQGNVEEALRFINHASRILSDSERRARYDNELALSTGTTEQRIAHVVTHAVAEAGEQTDVGAEAVDDEKDDILDDDELEAVLTGTDGRDALDLHHPGLTERVATFGRSPIVTLMLCALFGAFIAAAIVFVTPDDAVLVAKQVLVWLTLGLLGLTVVYGAVHGAWWLFRGRAPHVAPLQPQTDLAILNWRREKSVFLGTNQPQEDASWIFQLRMAELERAKSGRTSEPRPWQRLGARLFDYAIWGLVLALLLSELKGAGAVPEHVAYWLGHPLVAPTIITGTWVPIEALLIASLATTPGKWLFGVYLQFSISDAYARRDSRTQFERGIKRAFRVWWEGLGMGFPLLAPFLIAVAYEKVTVHQETDWDFAYDCLVTHGPPGVLNLMTGVCGLAAMLWLYGVAWHQPMADSITWARATITDAIPSAATLGHFAGSTSIGGLMSSTPTRAITSPPKSAAAAASSRPGAPIDDELAATFAERRSRIAVVSVEGPRMLRAGNWRRAGELCRTWTELDLGNPDAWRCLGSAMQAQGYHQDAIHAFRKAKQYDPGDRTLDAAIDRSQKGIVADFINRYRK